MSPLHSAGHERRRGRRRGGGAGAADGPEPGGAAVGEAAHHEERHRDILRLPPALHGIPIDGGTPVLYQQGKKESV